MRDLRVPGLAFKSRLSLGNFAHIVFSSTMHTFNWTLEKRREEIKKETEMDEAK